MAAKTKETGGRQTPTAQRARLLRSVVQQMRNQPDTASAFARSMGLGENRWINVENGLPVSRMTAQQLAQKIPGLSVDYLWSGNMAALSHDLARRLEEASAPGKRTTRGPRGS